MTIVKQLRCGVCNMVFPVAGSLEESVKWHCDLYHAWQQHPPVKKEYKEDDNVFTVPIREAINIHSTPSSDTFKPGGGDFGGAGASDSWDSGSSSDSGDSSGE